MVTGYTATEYGDFLITSLIDPYYNTTKVISWEIIAGVQNFQTVGTVSTAIGTTRLSGNLTNFNFFTPGDKLILGNTEYTIDTIISPIELDFTENVNFTTTDLEYYKPTDSSNYFDYEYRWSTDNAQFSELRQLNNSPGYPNLLGLNFDPLKPLWLNARAEVAALSSGSTISLISITYTLETEAGVIESCPQFCIGCTDPFAMNGCANIEVCAEDNLFNPYDLNKSVHIYKQIMDMTSNIFGHKVQYFRTESDIRTEDVHLMEYSLNNVVDKQEVKVLVPDNEFPDESMTYDVFGMEFAEFEIHITAGAFEAAFGAGKKPRNKDYMFIPIINKMYEISSSSLADEFNHTSSYWRVMLVKYQNRSSVIKNQFEVDTDSLVTGVEEVFGERQKEEQQKDTNPQQFQTVSTSYRDGIRGFVNQNIKIEDFDLKNRWTVVSKNYYDLTDVTSSVAAVEYSVQSKLKSNDNLAVSMWFCPQFENTDIQEYILFGDLAANGSGFKIYVSASKFRINAGGSDYIFDHVELLQKGEWYGLVLNINNKFLQVSASLYRLDSTNNNGTTQGNRPQDNDNSLIKEYSLVNNVNAPLIWDAGSNYHLRGSNTKITNIRVFTSVIELEQHSNILNQYVVRDNQLSIIIDNAIPSLEYQRFKNAR